MLERSGRWERTAKPIYQWKKLWNKFSSRWLSAFTCTPCVLNDKCRLLCLKVVAYCQWFVYMLMIVWYEATVKYEMTRIAIFLPQSLKWWQRFITTEFILGKFGYEIWLPWHWLLIFITIRCLTPESGCELEAKCVINTRKNCGNV